MAVTKGQYDAMCIQLRKHCQAPCAIVIVLDGKHGSGWSLQTSDARIARALPNILEEMARGIRLENAMPSFCTEMQ